MSIGTATKQKFTLDVGTKDKKFKLSCEQLYVLEGDEIRWRARGNEKFTIDFPDGSPFDLNPLPSHAAVEYRPTVRQGYFKYWVIDEDGKMESLDPGIVVDPPTGGG